MTSLPQARRFDWANLGVRVASATVLVPAVLGAVWFSDMPGLRWLFLVLVAVAVALSGVVHPGYASLGMAGSSLLVTLNALRIHSVKP